MAASIPATVPVFITLNDGPQGDDILAANENTPNAEISALATMLGMFGTGKTQAYGTDILTAIINGTSPICAKASANSINVLAGVVWVADSGQTIRLPRRKTTTTVLTASDLDTGAMAIGYYYIYATADTAVTTPVYKFSASASTPTGYTAYEQVGWFYNESSGILDVTNNYIGNIRKNGRYPSNSVEYADATDSGVITSTSYTDLVPTLRFYAPSKQIKVLLSAKFYSGNAAEGGAMCLNIDGSDVSNTERWIGSSANAGISGKELGVTVLYTGTIAAATTVIKPRWKSANAAYNTHIIQKYITVEEVDTK